MPRKRGGPDKNGQPKKPPLTHFLCIPLVTKDSKPQLEASLGRFKQENCRSGTSDVFTDGNASADEDSRTSTSGSRELLAEKSLRPVGTLHLTLGVMSFDAPRLQKAIDFLRQQDSLNSPSPSKQEDALSTEEAESSPSQLQTLRRPISPPPTSTSFAAPSQEAQPSQVVQPSISPTSQPMVVDLKGLESMHAPHKTSVLHISPTDPSGRLYRLCDTLRSMFISAGFLVDDHRPLKLHATIINTIYAPRRRKKKAEVRASDSLQQIDSSMQGKINAVELLERYKDHVWAKDVVLDRVSICEMGAKKIRNEAGEVIDEQYEEVASARLDSLLCM